MALARSPSLDRDLDQARFHSENLELASLQFVAQVHRAFRDLAIKAEALSGEPVNKNAFYDQFADGLSDALAAARKVLRSREESLSSAVSVQEAAEDSAEFWSRIW